MKIVPVVVWLNTEAKNGETEITVVTKDGKSRHYNEWTLPLSVWDAIRENKCIVYAGKEAKRLIMVKEKEEEPC